MAECIPGYAVLELGVLVLTSRTQGRHRGHKENGYLYWTYCLIRDLSG